MPVTNSGNVCGACEEVAEAVLDEGIPGGAAKNGNLKVNLSLRNAPALTRNYLLDLQSFLAVITGAATGRVEIGRP